jgi:hypothetical protein
MLAERLPEKLFGTMCNGMICFHLSIHMIRTNTNAPRGIVLQVDLREYYLKDGLMTPGKKGISLNTDQWVKLRSALPSLLLAVDKLAPASTPSSAGGPSTSSTATQVSALCAFLCRFSSIMIPECLV